MLQFVVPYGEASQIPIGSLRDEDGAFITPTFAAGDVTTQQDDGTGFENADDATPTLDGNVIIFDVSAAEATVPSVLAGRRVYRIIDQTVPAAWLPIEFQIVTTDHPLAAMPNGVILQAAGNAAGQTTTNIRLSANPGITIRTGYFFIVTDGTGAGQGGYVNTYTAGATYDIVPERALAVALDATSIIKFYVDNPNPLTLADGGLTTAKFADGALTGSKFADNFLSAAKIANNALTAAKAASDLITAIQSGLSTLTQAQVRAVRDELLGSYTVESTGTTTTNIVVKSGAPTLAANMLKGGIVKFKLDTTTAALRGTSARILSNTTSAIVLVTADALPVTPAEDDAFWVL